MAPSPSPELARAHVEQLLDIAESTILEALAGRRPEPPRRHELPEPLHRPRGAFVTLTVDGMLNGCIGSIEGDGEPLGHGVARLALSAAFADPRLPALRPADLPDLTIEISLLSALTPIPAESWDQLLAELRPGHDGLVLRAGRRQGLFLPSVWEQLPDPVDFLDHLHRKAGLAPRSWPVGMEAQRFTAERHSRQPSARRAA